MTTLSKSINENKQKSNSCDDNLRKKFTNGQVQKKYALFVA